MKIPFRNVVIDRFGDKLLCSDRLFLRMEVTNIQFDLGRGGNCQGSSSMKRWKVPSLRNFTVVFSNAHVSCTGYI